MKKTRVVLVYPIIGVLLMIVCIYAGYEFLFIQPNKVNLRWIENAHAGCLKTSSPISHPSLYADLQEIIDGIHSGEKIKKYADIFKNYSLNEKCDLVDRELCLDSFLYISRAFLVRGNKRDIKATLNTLSMYKAKRNANIYFDIVMLALTLTNGEDSRGGDKVYTYALQNVKSHMQLEGYYSLPHDRELCSSLLDHVGAVYLKLYEYSPFLYIQYHLK